ncbi:hypothetical protein NW764_000424 [Fusarium oxysporum]|nr:hypothetical protein NW764_000424 [Fusarium oxysporum]
MEMNGRKNPNRKKVEAKTKARCVGNAVLLIKTTLLTLCTVLHWNLEATSNGGIFSLHKLVDKEYRCTFRTSYPADVSMGVAISSLHLRRYQIPATSRAHPF